MDILLIAIFFIIVLFYFIPKIRKEFKGVKFGSEFINIRSTNAVSNPSPYAFWIGLPLMLLFVFAGIGGGSWALNRILLERTLYKDGEVASGIILQKNKYESQGSSRSTKKTVYTVSYRFQVGTRNITNDARIEGKHFYPLKKGGPIEIRYLPDDPNRNLPDGSRLSRLFIFFSAFGIIIGLGALVVVIGMIVDRVRK